MINIFKIILALKEVKEYCAMRNDTIKEPCEKCIFGNGCCLLNNDPMWWGIDPFVEFYTSHFTEEGIKTMMEAIPAIIERRSE